MGRCWRGTTGKRGRSGSLRCFGVTWWGGGGIVGFVPGRLKMWDPKWTHSMVPVASFLSFFVLFGFFWFRFLGAATKCLPTRPGRCPLSRLLDQARLAAATARRMLCVDCPFSLRPRTRVEVKRVRQVLGCYQDRESRAVCDSSKSSLDLRQFLWQKEVLNETLSTP